MDSPPQITPPRLLQWYLGGIGLLFTACLPWWRNHAYIRDFMDYGLVMAANGRINDGEAPYVDFVTPIQAGFLHLNRLVEIGGGGTYLGMTWGGLALIIIGAVILFCLLRLNTSPLAAAGLTWVIIVCTASQHTIIWHNTLGVLCLTVATWCAAVVTRDGKARWLWYLGLGAALWIGGINKISFHLVALVGAVGFGLRAVLLGRIPIKRAAVLGGLIALAGIVLPVVTELLLTGASFSQWRYNVLELARGSRAEYLAEMGKLAFYLRPIHDYYGPLPVPQFGLLSIALFTILIAVGWPGRSGRDRFMLVLAAIGCGLACLLLLATNHEIAYVSGGGAIALAVALSLGFGIGITSRAWAGTLAVISALFAGPAWLSAWKGERTQFGHSASSRSSYEVLADQSPEFSYLKGVRIPPEAAESYAGLGAHLSPPDPHGQRPVFYATGVEWLERVWPMIKIPGLPLWMHDGTSYGPKESDLLLRMIMPPAAFDQLITSVPWDHWPGQAHVPVTIFTEPEFCGSVVKVYRTQQDLKLSNDPIRLINIFGTNFEPRLLEFDDNTLFSRTEEGRVIFGTGNLPNSIGLEWKGSRLRGEPVLLRSEGAPDVPLGATYFIEYEVDDTWHQIWEGRLELPPGETLTSDEVPFDGRQRELRFRAELDDDSRELAIAGWHPPTLLDSRPSPDFPPPLVRGPSPISPAPEDRIDTLIVPAWRPDAVFMRGGTRTDTGVLLHPGDQLWLRSDHPLKALNGLIQVPSESAFNMPLVRVLWWKAGRVQIAWQGTLDEKTRSHPFHAWSPGPEGWFGILVDPIAGRAPILVRINEVVPLP